MPSSAKLAPAPAWEEVITRAWPRVALSLLAAIGVALFVWQLAHRGAMPGFLYAARDGNTRVAQLALRADLYHLILALLVPALLWSLRIVWRVARGGDAGRAHGELALFSLAALPALGLPTIEVEHPYLTALLVIWLAAVVACVVGRELPAWVSSYELGEAQAKRLVWAGFLLFVASMGFLSHWRFVTFHAQTCDMSFEVNAVWGIVKHGVPTISVAAFLYGGKPLPQPYWLNHTPFIYYLYAPFFALFKDGRTLLWLQAAFMGSGTFGAYWLARRWFQSSLLAVIAAWLYVLNPNVQSYCLHDVHANVLAIPCVLLAAGLMEAGYARAAFVFAILTALCREEAPLYSAGLGLYWICAEPGRQRVRAGLAVVALSGVWLVVVSKLLMPAFGGQPRWEHFALFFDRPNDLLSAGKALLFNPIGTAYGFVDTLSVPYVVYCLLPFGLIACWGLRAAWFGVPAAALMLTSGSVGFYCPGMNYSAPAMPFALIGGYAGVRWWLERARSADALDAAAAALASPRPAFNRQAAVMAYVITSALFCNYLYGNILSKGYQLEYGASPLRRQNDYNRADLMGWVQALPPYGEQERALWDAIAHVPAEVPVLTSWAINPQLSNRDVSLAIDYSGGQPAPEERVDFVILDKLPMMQKESEEIVGRFRKDRRFRIYFENRSAVIFERIVHLKQRADQP